MNIILCTREEESRELAHGALMCHPDEVYLMHFRTPGSKNGVRLYQYPDGSLTPAGYIHYGIGQGNRAKAKADKYQAKADKAKLKADRYQTKADKFNKKAEKQEERGKAELEKDKEEQAANIQKYKNDELDSRMNKYGSLDKNEKKALMDEVNQQIKDLNLKIAGGTATKEEKEREAKLSTWGWDTSVNDAKQDLIKIASSKDNEQKEQFLKDAYYEGQTGYKYNAVVNYMREKSGDLPQRISVTQDNKEAYNNWVEAEADYTTRENALREQAKKEHPLHYGNRTKRFEELKKSDAMYNVAKDKINTAFEKYCETVLKDMNMPVNAETMKYIESAIMWY